MSATVSTLARHAGLFGIASAAGLLAQAAGVPAPWLTGPMLVTAVLSAAGIAPMMPQPVRDFALLVAGISIGSGVTPESIAAVGTYPGSLLIMAATVIVTMLTNTAALVVLSKWQARDAFFASCPGALSTVLIIAADLRADVARIAVVQLVRIFVLVAIMPAVLVAMDHGAPVPPRVGPVMTPWELAVLLAAALAVSALAEKAGIAGATILGAMASSAALTGPGWVHPGFPPGLSTIGFILIGIFIGQRFRGISGMTVLRTSPAAAISLFASLAVAVLGSWIVAWLLGVPLAATLVAFAPGGIEAMAIMAYVLGVDPVYVGVHHLARFVLVALLVPIALKTVPALRRDPVPRGGPIRP